METKQLSNRKTISSPVSLPFKATFLSMAVMAALGGLLVAIQQKGATLSMLFYVLVSWAILFLFLRPIFFLRKVEMDSDGLVVSSLFRSCRIPFHSISDAKAQQGRGCMFVTLQLTTPCAFGNRITFMPSMGVSVNNNPDLLLFQEYASVEIQHVRYGKRIK